MAIDKHGMLDFLFPSDATGEETAIMCHILDQAGIKAINVLAFDKLMAELEEMKPPRTTAAVILETKEGAEELLERMVDIRAHMDYVTLRDLNELLGRPTHYTDEKVGWTILAGTKIIQVREGYLLDLPEPKTLSV